VALKQADVVFHGVLNLLWPEEFLLALNGLLMGMYLLAFFCSCIHCPNDSVCYDVR